MSNVSKWVMVALIGFIIIGLVKNAAGTTAVLVAGGGEFNALGKTLSGGGGKAHNTGKFSTKTGSISLGG